MATTVIVAQARYDSTRLRGKVLFPIVDKPMMLHVVDRLKRVTRADAVVVATSDRSIDDAVAQWAGVLDAEVFRGSETDVLGRFRAAAKAFSADVIVRVCCDAPLLDSLVIDRAIEVFQSRDGEIDYLSNMMTRTFPRGESVEVIDAAVLEKLDKLAIEPHQREHVTPYLLEHVDEFRVADYLNDRDLSTMNWTVDTADDMAFVREVYKRLYRPGEVFGMDAVLALLAADAELAGKGMLK